MSDAEYDRLFREAPGAGRKTPRTADPRLPNLRVGGEPASAFPQAPPLVPMLRWPTRSPTRERANGRAERPARAGGQTAGYTLEVKIDGAASASPMRTGPRHRRHARNGIEGEDVTPNLRTVLDCPLRCRARAAQEKMECRGEVYLPRASSRRRIKQREKAGDPPTPIPATRPPARCASSIRKDARPRSCGVFTYQVEAPGLKLGIGLATARAAGAAAGVGTAGTNRTTRGSRSRRSPPADRQARVPLADARLRRRWCRRSKSTAGALRPSWGTIGKPRAALGRGA